jgi:hypothetical protein
MTEIDAKQVDALLAPLWRKNRRVVLERLARVHDALAGATPVDGSVRDDLHALAGTLGTYGWPDGSELAETILDSLSGRTDLRREELTDLLERLDTFTRTLARA